MTEDISSITNPKPGPMAIRFDCEEWMPYLADSNLSDDKKIELLKTLHSIVLSYVDLGFRLNPVQEICGEVIDLKAVLEAAVLNSLDQREGDAA
jgi:hypothetical protein